MSKAVQPSPILQDLKNKQRDNVQVYWNSFLYNTENKTSMVAVLPIS